MATLRRRSGKQKHAGKHIGGIADTGVLDRPAVLMRMLISEGQLANKSTVAISEMISQAGFFIASLTVLECSLFDMLNTSRDPEK
jgi:hypothetical protein